MARRGIDISAHQGDIDLNALKSEIDFVIIRVGYGTNGSIDSKFKRNTEMCERLGIPYGFYWYSYALDTAGAEKEANAFLRAITPYNPQVGCWFDMEDADGYKRKNGMPSNNTLKEICYTFCDKIERNGYYTGIYASLSWFNNQLAGDRLSRFDKWVAQWPTSGGKQTALNTDPNSRSNYSLWQFTSEGRFNNYRGNLDTNYAYKDFPNPGQHTNPQPAPAPQPAPQPAPTTPAGSVYELALGVMQGEYGDGEDRKNRLGTRYNEVQDFINHIYSADINTLANEVINENKYGTGDARKLLLGSRYEEVQNRVNEILAPASKPAKQAIEKGSRIKFTGVSSYSGLRLASWVHNAIFDVIEVSGDRVVIGKGHAVTAAVNIADCQRV